MTVLGISIGTKETGVCVLQEGQLVRREAHYYKRAWSERKMRQITNTYRHYVLRYSVDAIVVKVPPSKDHSEALARLLKQIERLAKKHGCAFDLITKAELKSRTATRSTKELIAYTSRLYPQLSAQYSRGLADGHRYDKKMYEAVLAAHIVGQWMANRLETAHN